MTRRDWNEAGGFLSCTALLAGMGVALVIPGLEWSAFVGTLPAFAYLAVCHFTDWSKQI